MDLNAEDPRMSRDKRPIEQVLSVLGFQEDRLGCFERAWGDRLTVSAVPWFSGWHFTGLYVTRRSNGEPSVMGFPEFRHPPVTSPVELLGVLYRACGDAFSTGGALPPDLEIGHQFIEHQRKTRALTPQSPTLWTDRQFLRFCLSYIDRINDWSVQDYAIEFGFSDYQLRIATAKQVLFCPARGTWLDTTVISARDLFRQIPKRFMHPVVGIQQQGNRLIIDSHIVPARWVEAN